MTGVYFCWSELFWQVLFPSIIIALVLGIIFAVITFNIHKGKRSKMETGIKEYRVIWEIDVDAKGQVEAAKEARQCQAPGTTALFFKVIDKDNKEEVEIELLIDPLDEEEE